MFILNLITVLLAGLVITFDSIIPPEIKSFMYALSLMIQDLILMVLPFIIFSFILDLIIKMRARASGLLLSFLIAVVVSNAVAIVIAYGIGNIFLPDVKDVVDETVSTLQPMWRFYIPQILPTEYAMPLSVVIGIALLVFLPEKVGEINNKIYSFCNYFLTKVVMRVIPIFITGLVIKIVSDKMLAPVINHYLPMLLLILVSSFTYTTLWACVLTRGKVFRVIANMSPSLAMAFTTMSSAVTLPSLIVASKKNTDDSYVATAILPPAANFHVMGDTFNITITLMAIMLTFLGEFFGIRELFIYIFYFIVYRFSTVGIPGGGIIILLPFFQQKFGFTAEMLTLVTTLYVIFDPFQTVLNIYGNGVFAIFFSKLYRNGGEKQDSSDAESHT